MQNFVVIFIEEVEIEESVCFRIKRKIKKGKKFAQELTEKTDEKQSWQNEGMNNLWPNDDF